MCLELSNGQCVRQGTLIIPERGGFIPIFQMRRQRNIKFTQLLRGRAEVKTKFP